jgi:hypothetical protein
LAGLLKNAEICLVLRNLSTSLTQNRRQIHALGARNTQNDRPDAEHSQFVDGTDDNDLFDLAEA